MAMLKKMNSSKCLTTRRVDTLPNQLIYRSDFNERKWFHNHGKSEHLVLSDKMMEQLRVYFNALDSKKYQFIDGQDLQDPLIVFGLCQDRGEVERMVKQIDTDSSGVIQFDEFVQIFKTARRNKASKQGKRKFTQFAKIITGSVNKQLQNAIDVQTSISQYKRKMILNLLKKKDAESIGDGKRIARQIAIKSQRSDLLPMIKKFN